MPAAAYVVSIHAPGGKNPRHQVLVKPRTVIGRVNGDILLPDPLCSTTHAELLLEGATLLIRDLGSTNGTFSDGKRIIELVWTPGLSVQIGDHLLTLEEVTPNQVTGPKGTIVVGKEMRALAIAPEPSYVLVVHAPGKPPKSEEIFRARSVVGRTEGDVILADAGCSSVHAEILFDGSRVRIKDLGSTNGTWRGEERVTELHWLVGDVLEIGAHRLELKEVHPRLQPAPVAGPTQVRRPSPPPAPAGPPRKALLAGAAAVLLLVALGGWALLSFLGVGDTEARPKFDEPREATVAFVWHSGKTGDAAEGGTAPARIRVGPNKTGTVSVGVSEEFAGGGGSQWRTAIWLAAFNATRSVGASIADYEFNVHVSGHTDGPSAGLLTTAAMLALLRGKELRSGTTVTGTINPDGTAGPVAGIVQKMEGAKKAGLKRFGFPLGCRNHKDQRTGQDVDLVATGQKLGLEVKELGDLHEAYEFLTRDRLPRTEPIADAELEPATGTQALLRAKLAGWKSRIERETADLKQEAKTAGVPAQVYEPLLAEAERIYDTAKRDERNGFLMPALHGYVQTVASFAAATRTATAFAYMVKGDQAGLAEAIKGAAAIRGEVDAFGDQLELKALGRSRGGQVNSAAAFTVFTRARSAALLAEDFTAPSTAALKGIQEKKLQLKTENLPALMNRITLPLVFFDLAKVQLEFARDLQDLIAEEGEAKPLKSKTVDRSVTAYASVSAAVLAYFDALITEEVARGRGLPLEEAKALVASRETDYVLAQKARLQAEGKEREGAGEGLKLMRLAAASSAFLEGAKLVNKWYSLGGSFDARGAVVLENRRALTAQLELARRNAREAAARAKAAAGFVPTPARLAYQTANARREGNDEEKLAALAAYWQASFWCELAAARGN